MERRTVIAIGRQYGSGGREIGRKLAARLGIPFYDKELLAIAAKDSGLSEELFRSADEKPASSFLYSLYTQVNVVHISIKIDEFVHHQKSESHY